VRCRLTSVMLFMLLGQTRVLYSMAMTGCSRRSFSLRFIRSSALPTKTQSWSESCGHRRLALRQSIKLVKMVNIGTLLAFVIVCIAVTMLRIKSPDSGSAFPHARNFYGRLVAGVPFLGVLFKAT